MREISITLRGDCIADKSPAWPALEVPDTDGVLAVHRAAIGGWQQHAARWSATHIPSGKSLPVRRWCDREMAVWYAQEFFREARRLGIDLASPEPLKGKPATVESELRAVFDRDSPYDAGNDVAKPVELGSAQ